MSKIGHLVFILTAFWRGFKVYAHKCEFYLGGINAESEHRIPVCIFRHWGVIWRKKAIGVKKGVDGKKEGG